jgi:hypothetical protein
MQRRMTRIRSGYDPRHIDITNIITLLFLIPLTMNYILPHPELKISYPFPKTRFSYFRSFTKWAANEDIDNHVGWIGIGIVTMTAICFPITMAAILFHGASAALIGIAMVSLVMVVIVNLAALSTRYTIPFLLAGILMDIIAITISIF